MLDRWSQVLDPLCAVLGGGLLVLALWTAMNQIRMRGNVKTGETLPWPSNWVLLQPKLLDEDGLRQRRYVIIGAGAFLVLVVVMLGLGCFMRHR
jgi:hypothetical protein